MKTRHTSKTATTGSRKHDNVRDDIIDWLRDAYAMERALESALEKHSKNEDLSAEVRETAATHLQETRRHAEDIRALLQSLGTDTSGLKTGLGTIAQGFKGMASAFARDERVKDLLDSYSMEHFEIACYTALAAAAERAGLVEVVQVCNQIIPDEERMAEALIEALPTEVTEYLFETSERSE